MDSETMKDLKRLIYSSYNRCTTRDQLVATKKYNHEKFSQVHDDEGITDSEYQELVEFNNSQFNRSHVYIKGR